MITVSADKQPTNVYLFLYIISKPNDSADFITNQQNRFFRHTAVSTKNDDTQLFDMMRDEGEDWACYYGETDKYRRALRHSRVYVAYEGDILCGYVRCRDDDGLCVFVYDLLVRRAFRGRAIGRLLMERVCADFPGVTVYVLSGVDGYYEKLGYSREGSIFKVDIKPAH